MNGSNYCGYVYSDNKRIAVRWIVPITILFSVFLSLEFLRMAIIDVQNRLVSIIVAVIFALLSSLMIWGREKALITLSLQYFCNDNVIQNLGKAVENSVDISRPLFISQVSIGGVTRVPWPEEFYLLSNEPILYVPNYEGNGLRVVQALVKKGGVILPINKNTHSIVEKLIGSNTIPLYPKVAYIQMLTNAS